MAAGHTFLFFVNEVFMKYISSRDNPLIKKLVKLKNKKYRDKENLFIVEGEKSVAEALQQKFLLRYLLLDAQWQQTDFMDKVPGVEYYQLASGLIHDICDTETPQGIAAVVQIPDYDFKNITKEKLLILLDDVSDPGNVGTIIRSGWALGADGILMTPGCADPFSPKVVRASMGGILHIPVYTNFPLETLHALQSQGYLIYCSDVNSPNSLYDQDLTGGRVIVIGNESRGISKKSKNLCDVKFKIPINSQADSLNAAVACGIILAEASQQRSRS